MNILFLNNGRFAPVQSHTLYSDLMREFKKHGHSVYVVSANEKRFEPAPEIYEDNGIKCVCMRIGNLTKCNLVEKAITMMTISHKYIRGVDKYPRDIYFDFVSNATDIIPWCGRVCKKEGQCKDLSSAQRYLSTECC